MLVKIGHIQLCVMRKSSDIRIKMEKLISMAGGKNSKRERAKKNP